MSYIENKIFDEIKVNDTASLKRMLTQQDIELFAIMSGDVNPAHVDSEFARNDIFHKIIAHGMWGASLISTVLGTQLPGPGTIYLEQGLKFSHPVAIGDTITVTVTVININPENHHVDLDCSCINQNGKTVISGVATVIAPTEPIKRKQIELPKVIFEKNSDSWYTDLIKNNVNALKTAIVHPVDKLSLQGAIEAAVENIILPILIGPRERIVNAARDANLDISKYQIIDTMHSNESAEIAVKMARDGSVDAIMKGNLHTDELMEPLMDKITGLRTGRRMSHVFLVKANNYPKPLFLTDAAINIKPNLDEKKDIIQNAIDLFHYLGFGCPKVAVISAVETVTEKIPSTLDATALCKMAERGQITGGILDGPLALDCAISIEAAREKGIYSQVAGNADIIIVPDIESGNILYKQMTYFSKMEAAGIVLGARVPVILTSRGSDEISRKASCAMALAYVRGKQKLNG